MHETLHKALKQAVRWGYMTRNPADSPHRRGPHPLTLEEARRLLETARGDRLEALYVVALHTGLCGRVNCSR
jgi:integrase